MNDQSPRQPAQSSTFLNHPHHTAGKRQFIRGNCHLQLWRLTLQLARRNWTILGLDTDRYLQIFPQRHWGTYFTTPLHSPGPLHCTSLQNIQCILPPKTYSTVLSPMPPEIQVPYCARRNIDSTFVFSFCVYKMHKLHFH